MVRFVFALALFAALRSLAAGASADDPPCRTPYVIPYAEQCNYAYKELPKNVSPQNLSAAFAACERAQNEALPCLKSTNHQTHVVALSALFRDVASQADIAMFAQQFRVAEALLREKLQVLDIVAREARPGDATPAAERKATQNDLADALAGQCTERALAKASLQFSLAKAHKYADLARLLKQKAADYTACAKSTTTPAKKAYVEYIGLVALEESGRASQASGDKDGATKTYGDCVDGANRSSRYAAPRVKAYLTTVAALCRGRAAGTYRVDQPQPLDVQDATMFKPLTLPKS